MKKKNMTVKFTAALALAAIFISVVWTWILFIYEVYFNAPTQVQDLSPEELEALLEQLQLDAESDSQIEIDWASQWGQNEWIESEEINIQDEEAVMIDE